MLNRKKVKMRPDLIWRQRFACSADFQSAVSPNCIRQGAENPAGATVFEPLRIENPRYGRLKICATITTCLCKIKALPKMIAKGQPFLFNLPSNV
jgi:hypothetical protein